MISRSRITSGIGAGLLLGAWLGSAPAMAAGPFLSMAGTWSGVGTATTAAGRRERLRCRADYDVGSGGDDVRVNLRCASDSYRFDLSGSVAHRAGTVTGTWQETTRNAAGTIEGRVRGDQISAAARGNTFSADLSLTTRGSQQVVGIRSSEGTELTAASIRLNKQ
jgi:hypothetical protein